MFSYCFLYIIHSAIVSVSLSVQLFAPVSFGNISYYTINSPPPLEQRREWERYRSFVRIRFRRATSAQLSRAVKADEISVVEPTQPLRLARQSKDN